MKSTFHGMGYLLNDNRASGGKVEEADLLGCVSCQALIDKKKWQAEGCYDHQLGGPICSTCERTGTQNFKQYLDRALQESYRREQNAKILGI
jgi:hypothetical protein